MIYLNPSFNDIVDLASARPDTVRITVSECENFIGVANGYGYTHTSLRRFSKELRGGFDYIMDSKSMKIYGIFGDEDEVINHRDCPDILRTFVEDFIGLFD